MGMDEGQRTSTPPRADRVISEGRFQGYHDYARRCGVNRFMYLVARAILQPAFLIWLRLSRTGREHFRGKPHGHRGDQAMAQQFTAAAEAIYAELDLRPPALESQARA